MLSFGLVGIVYKIALGRIDSISLVFFVYLFSTILTAVIWFTSVDKTITTSGLLLTFLASVLAVVGMLSYAYALKYGKVVIVVPIRNLALLITVVLAVTILREELNLEKVIGIVLAVISLVLLSK
jgi:uncharacterized membrane protein